MTTHRPIAWVLAVTAMFAAVAQAQENAAELLPADTGAFVQVNDLTEWRTLINNDPLFAPVREAMPHNRRHEAWGSFQRTMRMDGGQIVDRYLGSRMVIAGPRPGWNEPVAMMLRVSPADSQTLIDRLKLELRPEAGAFAMYSTPDGSTRFAYGRQWLSVAKAEHEAYVRQALTRADEAGTLADDEQFQRWVGRLPSDRMAVGFFRGHRSEHTAAVAVINETSRFTVHYAGRPPHADELFEQIGESHAKEVGPLPGSVLAVASINLYDPEPEGTAALDRLLSNKRFARDIAPHLDAPVVLFMAENDALDDPPGGVTIPVVGMAVKMRDPAVADDLIEMVNNAMLVASVATVNWGTPPIMTQSAQHREHRYRVADVGVVLAMRTERDELRQVRLSYGAVGDWFVICSNDQYFNACIDAQLDQSHMLKQQDWFINAPIDDVDRPIASVMLRASKASAHLRVWSAHFEQTAPADAAPLAAGESPWRAGMRPADVATGAASFADVLHRCDSITMQFHRDGEALIGRVHVNRTASPSR